MCMNLKRPNLDLMRKWNTMTQNARVSKRKSNNLKAEKLSIMVLCVKKYLNISLILIEKERNPSIWKVLTHNFLTKLNRLKIIRRSINLE